MWQNYTNRCEKTDETIQMDLTRLYKSMLQHYTNGYDKPIQMNITSIQMDVKWLKIDLTKKMDIIRIWINDTNWCDKTI